jgi:hypothetical protein
MGTRHLIAVVKDNEYKVAQYGQWDGYPEGQGKLVLNFLLTPENVKALESKLLKVRFIESEGRDKDFVEEYNKNISGNKTPEQAQWFEKYKSRDIGAKILTNISTSTDEEIILINNIDFAGDSLMCEWAYVIDLDKRTFEVYEGFNKVPISEDERFASFKKEDGDYYQVKAVAEYSLESLPSEDTFLSELSTNDDDE